MVKRVVTAAVTICAGIGLGVLLAIMGHDGTAIAATPPSSQSVLVDPASGDSMGRVIASQEPQAPLEEIQDGYFIKEYKGRVSVVRSGSDEPEMIFDISTKMLPEVDRQQLAEGIYVETYEELIRLVEDYIS